jgi:serine/threonine-protein kinase
MAQSRTLNNRYELEKKIGDGGMAVVFKAQDMMLSRPVAVKVLRDNYASDPQFLERFRREARAAAGLNHPHIVNVYDVGQEGQIYYIVMEFIEGASLKDLITRNVTVSVPDAVRIAGEICDAIGYAHEKGLVHRDLKPQNILMTRDGRSKVTDFGIAKQVGDQTLTQAGYTLGTVQYFSPEQAKGQTATPQSDLYSIGIIIYEMLTGRIPFEGDNPVAIAIKHIDEAPPAPRRFNPNIPPALEAIVMKAMSKNPNNRYASAAALKKALQDFASINELDGNTVAVQTGTAMAVPPRRPQAHDDEFFDSTPAVREPTYKDPTPPPRPPKQPTYAPRNPNQTYVNQPSYNEQTRYDPNFAAPPQPVRPAVNPYNNNPYPSQRAVNAVPQRTVMPEPPPVDYQEDFTEPRRSGPSCAVWAAGGLLILMLVALVVFIVAFLIPNINRPAATATVALPTPTSAPAAQVAVPNLVGKTQPQAEDEIKRAKLEIGKTEQKFDEKVEAGKVLAQNPAANQRVNTGTKIDLVISSGPDVVDFNTRFVNVDPKAVEDALNKLGLKFEKLDQPNDVIQKGAVVRTDPEGGPGIKIAKSTVVKIYISAGPLPTATPLPTNTPVPPTVTPTRTPTQAPPSVVPNGLIGLNRAQAQKLLEDAGFQVEVVEWNEDDIKQRFPNDAVALETWKNLKVNQVLGTDPREGTQRPRGSKVTMAVKKQ